jgi:ribosome-associated heat shock protein Hsp15
MDSERIDKWLWAARFFKSRALASKACDLGRILWKGLETKPSREIRVGEMLRVRTEAGEFDIEVLSLNQSRGPAATAQAMYRETDESRQTRIKLAAELKAMQALMPLPDHRPSKRDRRRIIQFRGRG